MEKIINELRQILKPNDKIVAGISGGPDSMCLLDLLIKLKKEIPLKIVVAHVHHNVRKESDEEALFVKNYCQKNDCLFEMLKIEKYNKENFHEYARNIRYNFFTNLIDKYQAQYLMTAHHGDDLMETILMRLTRGSNFKGYAGFSKMTKYNNYTILRPLINTTKKEIEEYNKLNNIEYRIDASNAKEKYTRNRYRLHVLPFLKEENSNVHQKFLKFSEDINLIENYLVEKTRDVLTNVYVSDKVCLCEFNKLHELIKKRVIEYILKEEYQDDLKLINEHHVSLILKMCESPKSNLKLFLPKNRLLIKSYDSLYFASENNINKQEQILTDEVIINNNEKIIKLATTNINKSNYILRLDSKEISLPLKIRYKQDGDKIALKNLNGHKKIKDIFIDEKIPLDKRASWPIVVDSENKILWIPGLKKSKFDKNNNEFYDIIYKYVNSEEKLNEKE